MLSLSERHLSFSQVMLSLSKKLPPALWKGELSFAFDSFAPSRSERLPALAGEPLISEGILLVRDAIVSEFDVSVPTRELNSIVCPEQIPDAVGASMISSSLLFIVSSAPSQCLRRLVHAAAAGNEVINRLISFHDDMLLYQRLNGSFGLVSNSSLYWRDL